MILASAVSSGVITAMDAWPEYFDGPGGDPGAFPSTDADMSAFQVEQATPESFAHDMELLEALAANQHVSVREEPEPQFPGFSGLPHPEWT